MMRRRVFTAALTAALGLGVAPHARAATVSIINGNAAGVGFNDPTPRAPIGGNTGTTLGQQRLIAFQRAADIWGAEIDSPVPIRILATFEAQTCTPTSATLGAAGSRFIYSDFPKTGLSPGPLMPNLWHGGALADKRAGFELDPVEADGVTPRADIRARFNSLLNGNPACLGGRQWYLGLDRNHGADIDLITVLLHEFGHGLGFQQFASVTTGAQIQNAAGVPLSDAYAVHIFDNTQQKYWNQMTDDQRAASAKNPGGVVFDGPTVNAAVPSVLPGAPALSITAPAAIAGNMPIGTASFGAKLTAAGVSSGVVLGLDVANAAGPSTTDACTALTNTGAVAGKIALVDRGTCGFVVKVKNAQDAGAVGVIVADNVAGAVAGMGGFDLSITIPAVRITLANGNAIKAQLAVPALVSATIGVNPAVHAGSDATGHALLYTPAVVSTGSTISHWDTSAYPNQLMEPFNTDDLTHSVKPPEDLTLPLLRDIGWFPDADVDGLADNGDQCPASDRRPTVIIDGENTGVANPMFTSGCTIADLVLAEAAGARNHGGFVSGVAHLLNALRDAGIISGAEKGRMQSAAAHSSLP
jgi:PA domain-containing protein